MKLFDTVDSVPDPDGGKDNENAADADGTKDITDIDIKS